MNEEKHFISFQFYKKKVSMETFSTLKKDKIHCEYLPKTIEAIYFAQRWRKVYSISNQTGYWCQ